MQLDSLSWKVEVKHHSWGCFRLSYDSRVDQKIYETSVFDLKLPSRFVQIKETLHRTNCWLFGTQTWNAFFKMFFFIKLWFKVSMELVLTVQSYMSQVILIKSLYDNDCNFLSYPIAMKVIIHNINNSLLFQ